MKNSSFNFFCGVYFMLIIAIAGVIFTKACKEQNYITVIRKSQKGLTTNKLNYAFDDSYVESDTNSAPIAPWKLPPHTIFISFERSNHIWSVGAPQEYASAHDDPCCVQTDFYKGYAVTVKGGGEALLFHNCCTTNILIGTNYEGTVTIGTNKPFKINEYSSH